jgi:hypothetical protein
VAARRDGFGVVFPDGLSRAWADFRPNSNRHLSVFPAISVIFPAYFGKTRDRRRTAGT